MMGISERKEREKVLRHEQILDAAQEIFQKFGWSEATMDQVADAAELSKGTLYLYFKDKEELYTGLGARGMEKIAANFWEILNTHANALEALVSIGSAYHEYFMNDPLQYASIHFSVHKLLEMKDTAPSEMERMHLAGSECLKAVAEVIKRGITQGVFDKTVDPTKAAIAMWSYADGALNHLICKCPEHDDFEARLGVNMQEAVWAGYRWFSKGIGASDEALMKIASMRDNLR